jgi:hypothetical protein
MSWLPQQDELAGILGGALEARGISASGGRFRPDARGEIVLDGNTLVIKRIIVQYHLKLVHSDRGTAERVHGVHNDHCPVARTIGKCIEMTTSLRMSDID